MPVQWQQKERKSHHAMMNLILMCYLFSSFIIYNLCSTLIRSLTCTHTHTPSRGNCLFSSVTDLPLHTSYPGRRGSMWSQRWSCPRSAPAETWRNWDGFQSDSFPHNDMLDWVAWWLELAQPESLTNDLTDVQKHMVGKSPNLIIPHHFQTWLNWGGMGHAYPWDWRWGENAQPGKWHGGGGRQRVATYLAGNLLFWIPIDFQSKVGCEMSMV